MKLKSAMSKFLTNKWVLNIIAFLALFNVIGYAVMGNLNAVLYFVIFAVLVRYFSKNMTIVLGVPLIIVNLLAMRGNIEGMTNNSDKDNAENPVIKANEKEEKKNKLAQDNKNKPDSKTGQGLAMAKLSENVHENNAAQSTSSTETDGFEPGRAKNRGYDIDYATTIEDAYDELNNILGSDGIQRLTSDSQNLMKQQMQLAEAMKGMTPLIKSIEPMVQNLQGMMGQMGDGKNGLGGIMDLAKKFSGQASVAK